MYKNRIVSLATVLLFVFGFIFFTWGVPARAAVPKTVAIMINSNPISFDVPPYIDAQNRTIVPLRFIGEEMGYTFAWDAQNKIVSFTGNRVLIILPIGKKEAIVDGDPVTLDTEAVTSGGRAMVPLRFVLETMGAKVEYVQETNTINIMNDDKSENDENTEEEEKAEQERAEAQIAVILEDIVNVRSGPATTYDILLKVAKGDAFSVLQESDGWYQVALNDSSNGWIAGWLVSLKTNNDLASRSEEPGEGRETPIVEDIIPVNLTRVSLDTDGDDTYLTVRGDDKLTYATFNMDDPKRLVIDFSQCVVEAGVIENEEVDQDLVQGLRGAQFDETTVRLVFDLNAAAGLVLVDSNDEGSKLKFKVVPPSIEDKIIVLDAGHALIQPGGWSDPGAIGPSGIYERDVVLDITLKLKDILEEKGADVIMTRTGDTTLTLAERAEVANDNMADIFVSIHANANNSSSINGTSTYYYTGVEGQIEARAKLASCIQENLVSAIERKNLGTMQAAFAVLKYTGMPSVLVETAFISNREEEALLAENEFRIKIAEGIAAGIEEYFLNP